MGKMAKGMWQLKVCENTHVKIFFEGFSTCMNTNL